MENGINTVLIEKFMKDKNLSKTAFCKFCKIGYKTFTKIMTGQRNMNLIGIIKIAVAMGIKPSELFYQTEGQ